MIVVALTAAVDVTHIVHVAVISEVGGRGLAANLRRGLRNGKKRVVCAGA